jgi:ankyrin repeat protein
VESAPGGGLFAAGWWDDTANLELLIHAGARIDIVVGVTPFLASWCWKKFKAAKLLALNGANVNFRDDKGRTALHHGVEKEFDPSVLRWLVNHGASPEIKDREGMSARLRASRKRDKRFLAALIL